MSEIYNWNIYLESIVNDEALQHFKKRVADLLNDNLILNIFLNSCGIARTDFPKYVGEVERYILLRELGQELTKEHFRKRDEFEDNIKDLGDTFIEEARTKIRERLMKVLKSEESDE